MTSPVEGLNLDDDRPRVDSRRLLVTPEAAATMLSIGRTTIYELLASGELRSVSIGRARRVPMTELERYIDRLLAGAGE